MRRYLTFGVFGVWLMGALATPSFAQDLESLENPQETAELHAALDEQLNALDEEEVLELGGQPVPRLLDPYRVMIKASFNFNYVFAESPDSFIVDYKLEVDEKIKNQVDIKKGDIRVNTDVQGFLAKWPTGECQLNIGVSEIPYQLSFNKVEEEKIRLDLAMEENITEKFDSNCVFTDAPGSKFNTSGAREQMLINAIRKSAPQLRGMQIPVDRYHKQPTKVKIPIERFSWSDAPLGSAEIEGAWEIEIIPES